MSLSLADISVYSPEKTVFSIKTVREKIRVDAYIKPIESKRKVFVLEHAELMSAEAQNAMLKILEEPPDSVIFILLTTSAALLLPTIRSRCLTLTLREPETDRAFTYIKQNSEYHDEEIKTALESTDNNRRRFIPARRQCGKFSKTVGFGNLPFLFSYKARFVTGV